MLLKMRAAGPPASVRRGMVSRMSLPSPDRTVIPTATSKPALAGDNCPSIAHSATWCVSRTANPRIPGGTQFPETPGTDTSVRPVSA